MKYRHKLKIKRSWTSALVISPLSLSAKVKGFGEVVVIWKSETKLTFEAIQVFKSKNLKLNSWWRKIYSWSLSLTLWTFQGGGDLKRKEGKLTFETTRGISAQPSSSLSSHSGRKRKDEQGAGMGLWLENLQGLKRHAGTWRRRLRSGQTLQLQTPLCTWEIWLINCFQLSRTAE